MPLRFDTGSINNVERTPQGGLKVPAFLTRTGVFMYKRLDGTIIREYRPPEEVFHPDSLASLASAPVTLKHPPTMVAPQNFQKYNRGNVHGEVRQDGDKISAVLMVQDEDAIKAVTDNKSPTKEISCGYHCDVDETPGVTPDGERYDRKQIHIRYNHVALVPKGRAGREVRLRLDSDDNELIEEDQPKPKDENMKKVRIDGVEYEIGTDSYFQARERQVTQLTEERDQARKDADEARARADQAQKALAETEAKLKEATAPARLDAMVAQRTDLLEKARAVLGAEFKLDGLSERQVMEQVLVKQDPEIKLDGESDDYVRAAFTFATRSTKRNDSDDTDGVRRNAHASAIGLKQPKTTEVRGAKKARQDMVSENLAEWQKPLAVTKREIA